MTVKSELLKIRRGPMAEISPRRVVDWARAHPKSALYKDMEAAAENGTDRLWLQRAGALIRVHIHTEVVPDTIVTVRVTTEVSVGPSVLTPDGGSIEVDVIKHNAELMAQVYKRAISELAGIRKRGEFVPQLRPVWEEIDRAVEEYKLSK